MVSVVPVVPVEVPLMVPDKHMAVKLVLALVVGPFDLGDGPFWPIFGVFDLGFGGRSG